MGCSRSLPASSLPMFRRKGRWYPPRMPHDEVQVSVRMADRGEVGYRAICASVNGTEGSLGGAPVDFSVVSGPGVFGANGGPEKTLTTDEWGIAEVNWYPVQQRRSDPASEQAQVAVIRARCEDPRAREVRISVTQTGW